MGGAGKGGAAASSQCIWLKPSCARPRTSYTLLIADSSVYSISPNFNPKLPAVRPAQGLCFDISCRNLAVFLVANNALPVQNVKHLIAFARAKPDKIPRRIAFVDALPRTVVGKAQEASLRGRYRVTQVGARMTGPGGRGGSPFAPTPNTP